MTTARRTVLALLGTALAAGCTGSDGTTPTAPGETPAGGATPTPPGSETPTCDPAGVTRPPVVDDPNFGSHGYGTKPAELTAQSVADYLSDFETAVAWNRILAANDDLTSINVDTIDGYQPEATSEGFLAGSRIETSYSSDGGETTTENAYVTNYFVSAGPVYRVETASTRGSGRTDNSSSAVSTAESRRSTVRGREVRGRTETMLVRDGPAIARRP